MDVHLHKLENSQGLYYNNTTLTLQYAFLMRKPQFVTWELSVACNYFTYQRTFMQQGSQTITRL